MLKALAGIMTAVVILVALGIVGFFCWLALSANHALVRAQEQAGAATVAAGQAKAAQAAQRVIIAGEARQHLDIQVHQDNADAIAAAPGASAPIDPGLVTTLDRGLCRYPSVAADPRCARLRQPDPAVVSQPSP